MKERDSVANSSLDEKSTQQSVFARLSEELEIQWYEHYEDFGRRDVPFLFQRFSEWIFKQANIHLCHYNSQLVWTLIKAQKQRRQPRTLSVPATISRRNNLVVIPDTHLVAKKRYLENNAQLFGTRGRIYMRRPSTEMSYRVAVKNLSRTLNTGPAMAAEKRATVPSFRSTTSYVTKIRDDKPPCQKDQSRQVISSKARTSFHRSFLTRNTYVQRTVIRNRRQNEK